MIQDFENTIDNIKNISLEEKKLRKESLNLFAKEGFPNKRIEEWKFTDLNKIINNNFKELQSENKIDFNKQVDLINDFEHNSIVLINGVLNSNNFQHEDTKKIIISPFKDTLTKHIKSKNSLINLNNALFKGGYSLEILSNYKFNKPLIVYNYSTENLKNKIFNNKNLIIMNSNSELNLIELNSESSEGNFILNNYTKISVGKGASLKNFTVQTCVSNGFSYKFLKVLLDEKSNYEDCIFSSGLKFNKTEEDIEINGEEANCVIQSGLFLDSNTHQEIKTQINHLKPNSKSYQKIKNILTNNAKGAYQGKIFVKDIAQKTDAYQLSKALLLNDSSEFNAKPELEIYADDVKCSHGSTSGSISEDSIYYLMSRGIPRQNAIKLLNKAFLFEIVNSIKNKEIKKFIEKHVDRQIHGY
jgi:Fe-S cluster assembly protein SufD